MTDRFLPLAPMRDFLHTELAALLARAGLAQVEFARLTGYTVQQVNAWCRGRSAVPRWAGLLLVALQEISPAQLEAMAEDEEFAWHEVLGVSQDADRATLRRALARLGALHHPDKGGEHDAMQRVNAAYEEGTAWL